METFISIILNPIAESKLVTDAFSAFGKTTTEMYNKTTKPRIKVELQKIPPVVKGLDPLPFLVRVRKNLLKKVDLVGIEGMEAFGGSVGRGVTEGFEKVYHGASELGQIGTSVEYAVERSVTGTIERRRQQDPLGFILEMWKLRLKGLLWNSTFGHPYAKAWSSLFWTVIGVFWSLNILYLTLTIFRHYIIHFLCLILVIMVIMFVNKMDNNERYRIGNEKSLDDSLKAILGPRKAHPGHRKLLFFTVCFIMYLIGYIVDNTPWSLPVMKIMACTFILLLVYVQLHKGENLSKSFFFLLYKFYRYRGKRRQNVFIPPSISIPSETLPKTPTSREFQRFLKSDFP